MLLVIFTAVFLVLKSLPTPPHPLRSGKSFAATYQHSTKIFERKWRAYSDTFNSSAADVFEDVFRVEGAYSLSFCP